MSKNDRRSVSQGATSLEYYSHAQPELHLEELVPALVHMDKAEIEPLPTAIMSLDIMSKLEARGAHINQIPFRYYRDLTYQGQTRAVSNEDILKGKEPLYENLAHALEIRRAAGDLVRRMLAYYEPRVDTNLIASMEMQDLNKITMQQWKPTGWFCASPVTDADVPERLPQESLTMLHKVAKEYGRILATTDVAKGSMDLALLDSDPNDTMTGAPTFAAGDRTHDARLAILAAIPNPKRVSPSQMVAELEGLGVRIGFPDRVIYSPVVSTRMGPLKKPTPLFARMAGGYVATHQAVGLYNRTRFVFPAPYYVNFLLSPIYVQMSEVRRNKLGLWHDPERQAKYLQVLKAQGKNCYSIDFSGMDTAMWPPVIMGILDAIKRAGFYSWSCEFFEALYPRMGVTLPDYGGSPNHCSLLTGPVRPWCSGFKLTSEFDTIYGAAVLLSALERQIPGISDQWISGEFVFLELGDDIMFTTDHVIDAERLSTDALELWGAKLEIIHDAMFLKWFLPLHPDVPKLTRSMARFIQQTLYNEDRYSGIEGGDRPPAILRLGLMARLEGLLDHPDFHKWWPSIYDVISQLKFITTASDKYKADLKSGKPSLDEGDVAEILKYAQSTPSYFASLADRAKFEPSAAHLLRLTSEMGMDILADPTESAMRQLYYDELLRDPTDADIQRLLTFTNQFLAW